MIDIEILINNAVVLKTNSVPLNVLLDEAGIIAGFVNTYYTASNKYPGLSIAGDDISPDFGETLLLLCKEASSTQFEYLRQCELDKQDAVTGVAGAMRDWIAEMKHILRWAFRSGRAGTHKGETKNIEDFIRHMDTQCKNVGGMAQAINDYMVFVASHEGKVKPEWGYTPEFLVQGEFLMQHSHLAKRGRPQLSKKAKALLERRQKLQALITERVRTVRSAARFVFRNHPERIKEVTSTYERKRRTAARKKQQSVPAN